MLKCSLNARLRLMISWPVLLIALLLSELASAQTLPNDCNPNTGGTRICTGKLAPPYGYFPSSVCVNASPLESESQALAAWEDVYLDNISQCPGYTYERLGWIPDSTKMCIGGGCQQDPSAPSVGQTCHSGVLLPSIDQGIEIWNYLIYEVEYDSPAPQCSTHAGPVLWGPVWRNRVLYCPRGYTFTLSYCYLTALDVAKNLGEQCPSCGNPISPGPGNKFQKENDYRGTGEFPLEFVRFYNSLMRLRDDDNGYYGLSAHFQYFGNDSFHRLATTQSEPTWVNLGLDAIGANWRHSYQRTITYRPASTGGVSTAYAYRPDGRVFAFTNTGGLFKPQADVNDQITRLTDVGGNTTGWKYVAAGNDEVENYDATGRLLSIHAPQGKPAVR